MKKIKNRRKMDGIKIIRDSYIPFDFMVFDKNDRCFCGTSADIIIDHNTKKYYNAVKYEKRDMGKSRGAFAIYKILLHDIRWQIKYHRKEYGKILSFPSSGYINFGNKEIAILENGKWKNK